MTNILLEGQRPINLEDYGDDILNALDDERSISIFFKSVLIIHSFIGSDQKINVDKTSTYFDLLAYPLYAFISEEYSITSELLSSLFNHPVLAGKTFEMSIELDTMVHTKFLNHSKFNASIAEADYIVAELSEINLSIICASIESKKPTLLFSFSENDELYKHICNEFKGDEHNNLTICAFKHRADGQWYAEYISMIFRYFVAQTNKNNSEQLQKIIEAAEKYQKESQK